MATIEQKYVNSTSDERIVNNTLRNSYRVLTASEKLDVENIKSVGLDFLSRVEGLGASRETSIAKTKIEEAVMWAVKHIMR